MPPSTLKSTIEKFKLYLLQAKLGKVMRITTLLLTICCLHASAFTEAQVTISVRNESLEKVFSLIKKQTGVLIMYNAKDLESTRPVTMELKAVSVTEALSKCLAGQNLKFSIEGNSVFISKVQKTAIHEINATLPDSLINIQGRITDSQEKAVIGATVTVKGSNVATSTGTDGTFSLTAIKKNAIILVTSVGYEPKLVKMTGEPRVSIQLTIKAKDMDEVTVYNTGFQDIPKERSTGSFVKVSNELINRNPTSTNIIDRLEGVTSGLLFDRRLDQNGTPKNLLQIRGLMTLSEGISQPLIVLDNFEYSGDINNINPNDVESITILRDAAAASIWGAKAANGVIVITTRKGAYNQKLKVNVNATVTTRQKTDLFAIPILNSSEVIDLEKFYFSKNAYDGIINDPEKAPISNAVEILLKQRNGEITEEQANTLLNQLSKYDVRNDFLKYLYRNETMQQYNADFSGGSKNYNYLIGIGFDKQLKELVGDQFNRVSFRLFNSFKPIDPLQIQIGINYTVTNNQRNSLGAFNSAQLNLGPNTNLPIYSKFVDEFGNHLPIAYKYKSKYTDTVGGGRLLDWKYRPLDQLANNDNTDKGNALVASLGLNYKINKWASIDVRYQYQRNNITNKNYYNKKSFFARDLINSFTNLSETDDNLRYPIPNGGILDLNNSNVESHGGRAMLNLGSTLNGIHQINGLIGINIDQEKLWSSINRTYGASDNLNVANVDYVNLYPGILGYPRRVPSINDFVDQTRRLASFFTNFGYTFDNRYTLTASFRRDASNLFGVSTNNKWKPFWSTGIGWNLVNEKFYNWKFLEQLNLRATYGYAGNVNNSLSSYYILTLFPATYNSFINAPYNTISSVGNPSLRWEKVGTFNVGFDWAIKNQVLSGKIEYYSRKAIDIIGGVPLDITTGYTSLNTNSAAMKGNGFDISISSRNIRTKSFKWMSDLNFSTSKTKVTKILQPTNTKNSGYRSDGNLIQAIEGYTPYLLVSYKWAGLDPTNGDPQGVLNGKVSKNYDSIVSFSPFTDQMIHGSAVPEIFGNLLNTFYWKSLSVSTNITYNFKYFLRIPSVNYSSLLNGNYHSDYRLRWQKPGDEKSTKVPSFVYPSPYNRDLFYQNSEVNVIKGDHIRLEDVRVSWLLNRTGILKLPFEQLSLFAYVSNLNILIWKANDVGIDPRFPNGNNSGKSFSFGFRAGF